MESISGILADLNGNVVEYGKGAEEVFGYKRSEIVGKPVAIFHPPAARETLLPRLFRETMEKGEFSERVTLLRKNGREFPALLTVRTVRDKNGNVTGLLGLTKDLSE